MQDRVASGLGVSHAQRIQTVVTMLSNNARRVPGYWIQLTLATGIATLGLVLGSTAVVIGAMLVSPLMGPIIELGMGFAVGSSLLVIRAAIRVLLSIGIVIAGAALMTLALPFHEVTSEIASRTSPTALDLLVAIFCALTAAYTAVRSGSDTTAAAAGTAIGIALVPPLCVAGFGIGTASGPIAAGATLLFTANFFAILVFAVMSFVMLGFNNVNGETLEDEHMELDATRTGRLARRFHTMFRKAFGSRYGLAMRLGIPALFLLAVYVPLGRALDEVSWEVRVRAAIKNIVPDEAAQAVQTSLAVEGHTIALRLLVVGSPDEGARLEQRLSRRIEAVSGVKPAVTVSAVPDLRTLTAAQNQVAHESQTPRPPDAASLATRVGAALGAAWPDAGVDSLAGWRLELAPDGRVVITAYHLGEPLGQAAMSLLSRDLSRELEQPVKMNDVALSALPLVASPGGNAAWVTAATGMLAAIAPVDGLVACVEGRFRPSGRQAPVDSLILAELQAVRPTPATRLVVSRGAQWSIRIARRNCERAAATPDSALMPNGSARAATPPATDQ